MMDLWICLGGANDDGFVGVIVSRTDKRIPKHEWGTSIIYGYGSKSMCVKDGNGERCGSEQVPWRSGRLCWHCCCRWLPTRHLVRVIIYVIVAVFSIACSTLWCALLGGWWSLALFLSGWSLWMKFSSDSHLVVLKIVAIPIIGNRRDDAMTTEKVFEIASPHVALNYDRCDSNHHHTNVFIPDDYRNLNLSIRWLDWFYVLEGWEVMFWSCRAC